MGIQKVSRWAPDVDPQPWDLDKAQRITGSILSKLYKELAQSRVMARRLPQLPAHLCCLKLSFFFCTEQLENAQYHLYMCTRQHLRAHKHNLQLFCGMPNHREYFVLRLINVLWARENNRQQVTFSEQSSWQINSGMIHSWPTAQKNHHRIIGKSFIKAGMNCNMWVRPTQHLTGNANESCSKGPFSASR